MTAIIIYNAKFALYNNYNKISNIGILLDMLITDVCLLILMKDDFGGKSIKAERQYFSADYLHRDCSDCLKFIVEIVL